MEKGQWLCLFFFFFHVISPERICKLYSCALNNFTMVWNILIIFGRSIHSSLCIYLPWSWKPVQQKLISNRFFKNQSFKIAMSRWVGWHWALGFIWALPLVNLFEKKKKTTSIMLLRVFLVSCKKLLFFVWFLHENILYSGYLLEACYQVLLISTHNIC